ncbi:DUF4431 domain-containing protein [Pseudomonas sp. LRF_L74]|uniref:DUF4431 domain-containing protein n=1 Tax=Pseudomonas sp. LRF_L74 TaxID=3369422 RepID=UPI003F5F7892
MASLPRALLCLGLATLPTAAALASPCQDFSPRQATLDGTLERQVFPGPPNYEDIETGDAAETGFYLSLAEPACVRGNQDEADIGADDDVRLVQLVLDQAGFDALRPFLGQPVTLRGQLFSAFTGHHHAPLLMEKVERIETLASTVVNCAELAEDSFPRSFPSPWTSTVVAATDLYAAPNLACGDSQRAVPANASVVVEGFRGDWVVVRYSDDVAGWLPSGQLSTADANTAGAPPPRPNDAEVAALPDDVRVFIEGYATCEHFAGEEPYDEERGKEIGDALAEYCPPINQRLKTLAHKYRDDPVVTRALSTFEPVDYSPRK